jgi:hypothetical protein
VGIYCGGGGDGIAAAVAATFRRMRLESVAIHISETIKLSVASEQGIKALRLATGLHEGINSAPHYHYLGARGGGVVSEGRGGGRANKTRRLPTLLYGF